MTNSTRSNKASKYGAIKPSWIIENESQRLGATGWYCMDYIAVYRADLYIHHFHDSNSTVFHHFLFKHMHPEPKDLTSDDGYCVLGYSSPLGHPLIFYTLRVN